MVTAAHAQKTAEIFTPNFGNHFGSHDRIKPISVNYDAIKAKAARPTVTVDECLSRVTIVTIERWNDAVRRAGGAAEFLFSTTFDVSAFNETPAALELTKIVNNGGKIEEVDGFVAHDGVFDNVFKVFKALIKGNKSSLSKAKLLAKAMDKAAKEEKQQDIIGSEHIALIAETQFGKTGILASAILFYNLWCHTKGIKEICILINPPRRAPAAQTNKDFNYAKDLMSAITFAKSPKITLFEGNKLSFSIINKNAANTLTKSRTRKNEDSLDQIAKIASGGGWMVTLIIDEADEAVNLKSFFDHAMNTMKSHKVQARVLMCSATSWIFKSLERFNKITVDIIDPRYSGTITKVRTPVVSMTDIATLAGISRLKGFSLPDAKVNLDFSRLNPEYHPEDVDDIESSKLAVEADHEMVYQTISAFVRGIDSKAHGLNGKSFNGGSAGMLRYGDTVQLQALLGFIENRLFAEHGVVILRQFTGFQKSQQIMALDSQGRICQKSISGYQTIPDLVRAAKNAGVTKYIVAVVDAARRADRFGTECTVFLDFTATFGTMTSMEQGTLGRASGWNKIVEGVQSTVCMVSDYNAEKVRKFRKIYDTHGYKGAVLPVAMNAVSEHLAAVEKKSYSFNRSEASDEILEAFENIDAIIGETIEWSLPPVFTDDDFVTRTTPKGIIKYGRTAKQKAADWKAKPRFISAKYRPTELNALIEPYLREGYSDGGQKWLYWDVFNIIGKSNMDKMVAKLRADFGSDDADFMRDGCTRGEDGRMLGVFSPDGDHSLDGISKTLNSRFIHISIGNVERDNKQGPGRRGLTGDRASRTPTQKSNNKDGKTIQIDFLFRKCEDGETRLERLTFPLSAVFEDHHGVAASEEKKHYGGSKTVVKKHLVTENERRKIESIEANKTTRRSSKSTTTLTPKQIKAAKIKAAIAAIKAL